MTTLSSTILLMAGLTWEKVVDPTNNNNVVGGDRGIQSCSKNGLIFADAQNGWLTGSCNGVAAGVLLFQTHDGGKTWSNVNLPDPDNHPGIYQNFDAVCASQFPNVSAESVQLEVACKFMNAPLDQPVVLLYQSHRWWNITGKERNSGWQFDLPT